MPHNNADDREQFVESWLEVVQPEAWRCGNNEESIHESDVWFEQAKQQLLDRFAQERADELRELRKEFFFDPNAPSPGPLWAAAVAADVKAVHAVIDDRIAKLTKQEGEK